MVGIVVVSHGSFAKALISSAQGLIGRLKKIKGVTIRPRDTQKKVRDRIRREIAELDDGDGVLILTDVLGGTPTNIAMPLLERENVEVVTGVNVPMLMTVSSYRKGKSLSEIASLVKQSGRRSIVLAKEVMGARRVE
jgi:mannose PTS system EIIA component